MKTYQEVVNHLQNRQVYFRKGIVSPTFRVIAGSHRVHNIGKVEVEKTNDGQIMLTMIVDMTKTIVYLSMTDKEFYARIERNFIPVCDLIQYWLTTKTQKV